MNGTLVERSGDDKFVQIRMKTNKCIEIKTASVCLYIGRETGVWTRANKFFWAFGVVVESVVVGYD